MTPNKLLGIKGVLKVLDTVAVRTPRCAPTAAAAKNQPSTAVEVSWQDNSSDKSEFQVERRTEATPTWVPIGVAPANGRSLVDSTAPCSVQVYYRIRSYRGEDGQPSATYSNEATVRTIPCTPGTPLATALSPGAIRLSWVDRANDESQYYVEISQNEVSGWSGPTGLSANTVQYVAAPLACETTYYFRVRTYRSGDNAFSPYSGTVSATTGTCLKAFLPFARAR